MKLTISKSKNSESFYITKSFINENTLKEMNFADIKSQGYMPLYSREKINDNLHDVCGFRTDYEFITKSKMKTIRKNSKGRK